MAYLARSQKRNRALVEQGSFPEPLAQAAAWFWLSELMRRHPGKVSIVEGVYPGGNRTVWLMTQANPKSKGNPASAQIICRFYDRAHVTPTHAAIEQECPVTEKLAEGDDDRFMTIDGILSHEPRLMVEELEVCIGLGAVEKTPPTEASSIGARVIAEATKLFALTRSSLLVEGGLYDGVAVRRHLFTSFALLESIAAEAQERGRAEGRHPDRELVVAAAPWFFLLPSPSPAEPESDTPLAAINLDTGIFVSQQGQFDLMTEFRRADRDITALTLGLIRPV